MMGYSAEIISVDVYTEKTKIINDCLTELEPFIDSVIPNHKKEMIVEDVLDKLEYAVEELFG